MAAHKWKNRVKYALTSHTHEIPHTNAKQRKVAVCVLTCQWSRPHSPSHYCVHTLCMWMLIKGPDSAYTSENIHITINASSHKVLVNASCDTDRSCRNPLEHSNALVNTHTHTHTHAHTHTPLKTHLPWGGHIGLGVIFFFFSWRCLKGARLNVIPTLLQRARK